MEDLLAYFLSWVLDRTVPSVRAAWGNWGCFMASVLAAGILVWFLLQGEDWKAWLIVGPLATLAVVVMVMATYGLAKRSRSRDDEQAVSPSPSDQELGDLPVAQELLPQDIEGLLQELREGHGTISMEAEQHLDQAYAHAERDEFEDALCKCDAAVRFDPGYAEAHNLRGIVLEELGRPRRAIVAYRQAVLLDPAFSEAEENLSQAQADLQGRER